MLKNKNIFKILIYLYCGIIKNILNEKIK